MKILPLAVAVLAGVNYSSQAFTVTGGDFGTTPATGDVLDVPNFFESSTASYNYNDYTTTKSTHFSTNKGRMLGLDGNGAQGYVYQSIGTYSGESSLTLQCDSLFRDIIVPPRIPSTSLGQCTFSIWDLPISTAGVNGTDVAGLAGAKQLASFSFDASAQTYTGDTYTFLHTYSLLGATVGDNIWLDITKNGGPEVLLDNLQVVPEPASATLVGLAAASLMMFRRRKA
jgi:hypothetical protein